MPNTMPVASTVVTATEPEVSRRRPRDGRATAQNPPRWTTADRVTAGLGSGRLDNML